MILYYVIREWIFWSNPILFLKLSIRLKKVNRRLVINHPVWKPGAEEEAGGTFTRYHYF
jgi:hypothetical protein